ncbi:MAG TPA: PIN domain-containing protein [Nitrospinota bacterium]|jgi:hypothetical protein|nr:PIN domain-containing protein [Nitrospinota bacterium]|tara:strand:+ start:4002 stop:4403 length:402 start_codon:yes stop_codon:yes gene_type:complete
MNPVLVDTSVWIDWFAQKNLPHVSELDKLIENREDIALCGPILMETLQGVEDKKQRKTVVQEFSNLLYFETKESFFTGAADLYFSLRKKGVTIRKSIDNLIATTAMEYDLYLLHNDRDFKEIERHSKLKVWKF